MDVSGSNDAINDEIQDELFCRTTRSPVLDLPESVQSSRVGLTAPCVSRRSAARHRELVAARSSSPTSTLVGEILWFEGMW